MSEEQPEVERALNLGMTLDDFRAAAETLQRFRYLLPLKPFGKVAADSQDLVGLARIATCPSSRRSAISAWTPRTRACPASRTWSSCGRASGSRARPKPPAIDSPLAGSPGPPEAQAGSHPGRTPRDCRRMKELIGEYRDLVEALPAALRSNALLGVLPHIEEFVSGYEDHRRSEGVADFDDILIWARNVLRDNLDVRALLPAPLSKRS